jgi:hypothetical protein
MNSLKIQRGFRLKVLSESSLRTGVLTGILLNIVMVGALIVANRMPWLDRRAFERNAVAEGIFFLMALIPVFRFFRSPRRLFLSGLIAVVLLTLGYEVAGMYFQMLFHVLRTPVEVLIDGCVGYGVAAVLVWVFAMCRAVYRHAPVSTRRRHTNIYS